MAKRFFVYILASRPNGTLYVGVTSRVLERVWQHRTEASAGFTQRYGVHRLVYFEQHDSAENALRREKQLKGWRRAWKIRLIESLNSEWRDLYDEIAQ